MSSNVVLQPNPPHKPLSPTTNKMKYARTTLLQPPKKSHLHHCLNSQKKHFFHRIMWASLGFLCLGQSFTEKTGKREPSHLSLSCFSLCLSLTSSFPSLYYFFPISFSIFFLTELSSFLYFSPPFSLFLSFPKYSSPFCLVGSFFFLFFNIVFDLTMKRMKGVAAAMESSPYAILYEVQRTRLKHQSLMQDYEELYRETESQKRKLEMMKQKRLTLLSEVRFLRQRYKFLMQNQSQNPAPAPKYIKKQNLINVNRTVRKERNYTGNDAAVQCQAPQFDLNRKGKKVYSEREAALQTAGPVFDLSQKQKTYIGKEAALRNSATNLELNLKERIYSGKEAAARNNAPIFDLNQISREEEELQANGEVMRIDEPKISLIRGGSDEHHSDMKLSACRSAGNGSGRAGKRKISWQDQVALRV